MKITIGSDHAAFAAKQELIDYLEQKYQCRVDDVGTDSEDRCDYPVFAIEVAKKVAKGGVPGILLCGSGIGVSIVANRFKGVRAALCRTPEDAKLSRQHNDSNILCLGARINSGEEIREIADAWFAADFEGGRHSGRIEIFNKMIGEEVD